MTGKVMEMYCLECEACILQNVKLFMRYLRVILKSNTLSAHQYTVAHSNFTYEVASWLNRYIYCIVNILFLNDFFWFFPFYSFHHSSSLFGQQNKRYSAFFHQPRSAFRVMSGIKMYLFLNYCFLKFLFNDIFIDCKRLWNRKADSQM